MILFPDTSVWSLIFRRDIPFPSQYAQALIRAIDNRDRIATTGIAAGNPARFCRAQVAPTIIEPFLALPFVVPDRDDHIEAAGLRNTCRQRGIQVETIDALLAQRCIRDGMTMPGTRNSTFGDGSCDRPNYHTCSILPLTAVRISFSADHPWFGWPRRKI